MPDAAAPVILIVDDDPEWRDVLCTTLGRRYPVLVATTGDEALDIALRLRPAAIVMDVVMPGGADGFTTFCELRKRPETRDIPVVMFTDVNRLSGTHFSKEPLGEYFGKVPAAFLEKTVTPEVLLKEVERALQECR
jgi:CheY-like chemotaxis protein